MFRSLARSSRSLAMEAATMESWCRPKIISMSTSATATIEPSVGFIGLGTF